MMWEARDYDNVLKKSHYFVRASQESLEVPTVYAVRAI
jgi:hypothetical protein